MRNLTPPTPMVRIWSALSITQLKPDSHLRILYGNLASEGAVAKITGKEGLKFSGKAIVFDSEEESIRSILAGNVQAGHVVVIRNEGPVGGPGMRNAISDISYYGQGFRERCGTNYRWEILWWKSWICRWTCYT